MATLIHTLKRIAQIHDFANINTSTLLSIHTILVVIGDGYDLHLSSEENELVEYLLDRVSLEINKRIPIKQ